MSSTAAVASGVTYHFPKIDARKQNSNLKDNRPLECNGPLKNGAGFNSAKPAVSNIDAALHSSFKSFNNSSGNDMNFSLSLPDQNSLVFRESTVPSLDAVVKKKIESIPKALILSDTEHKEVSSNAALCADTELLNWCQTGNDYVPRRSIGLNNFGNTCYLNSVLQCLLASGPLLAYISARHSRQSSCNFASQNGLASGGIKSRFCALCGLYRLLIQHPQGGQMNGFGNLTPSYFVTNVKAICPVMRLYQQEDAHEFLLGLLSRMEDCLTSGFKKIPRNLSENNVIRRIFGGLIRSEVTCNSCRKVSVRDDPCFNLSLDITCSRSLQQCLYNYIRSENLCGPNAYKCENCRQLRPAVRRSTLFRSPPILIIQLNRFYRCQKLDTRVEYPSSFNIRPFMSEACGPPVLYRLFATVNHEGHSCRSGHYVAFTRRHSVWVFHNDSSVTSTSPESVLRQTPYLLFYEAVDPGLAAGITVSTETKSSSLVTGKAYTNHNPLSVSDIPLPSCEPPKFGPAGKPMVIAATSASSLSASTACYGPTKTVQARLVSTVRSETLTPTARFTPTVSGSACGTAPRIVFNSNVSGPQRLYLASASQPNLSNGLLSSATPVSGTNRPTTVSMGKLKNQSPPFPGSTNRGNLGTGISSSTVHKLLYGEHNTPDLWTEKSLPPATGDGMSMEVAASTTGAASRQTTKTPSTSSAVHMEAEDGSHSSSGSDSDSSASDSIVWMPVTRKDLTNGASGAADDGHTEEKKRKMRRKKKKKNRDDQSPSSQRESKKARRWREKRERMQRKRERRRQREDAERGDHRHHHHHRGNEPVGLVHLKHHRTGSPDHDHRHDRKHYYHHYQSNRHNPHMRHHQHGAGGYRY